MTVDSFDVTVHFNPRSREGSDSRAGALVRGYDISIHAPAKGATLDAQGNRLDPSFQSTLPRRERRVQDYFQRKQQYFNPRSREGSDDTLKATVKGFADFNPRSREGSDGQRYRSSGLGVDFNPRSREGSDSG